MASFPPRGASMPSRNSSMHKSPIHIDISSPQVQRPDETPKAADQAPTPPQQGSKISRAIREWTPTALMLSYFVFSISLYTLLNDTATKVFWFLYLTIATLVAGLTALEAYDGLVPLAEARTATMKLDQSDNKFKTPDEDLPPLELIIDLNYDESNGPRDFDFLKHVRSNLFYPNHKVRVNLLCREFSTAHALANDYDQHLEMAGVRICPIPAHACTSLAARMAYFIHVSRSPLNAVVAIYSAGQRPHPHGVRHAVEKLVTDPSISVIQGRAIAVPPTRRPNLTSALSTLEQDMLHGLLRPGRARSWGLSIASDTNVYWRHEALRCAATATANTNGNGWDLGHAALAQNAKCVFDLRVASYEPCPATLAGYVASRAEIARATTIGMLRYVGLAFRPHSASPSSSSSSSSLSSSLAITSSSPPPQPQAAARGGETNGKKEGEWTWKTRAAIVYALVVTQVTSHAIVQYLCLAVAVLATRTPTSALELAYAIYFPYPISEWFMAGGIVCLLSTVFMIYKARSEFVPLWTAPIVLALYPLFLAWRACLEIFAQFEVLVS